jgi:hypothetical protein
MQFYSNLRALSDWQAGWLHVPLRGCVISVKEGNAWRYYRAEKEVHLRSDDSNNRLLRSGLERVFLRCGM